MSELNDSLSERELEILRLVATGAANKEIARQLVISPNTVKVHLRNIFAKLGVSSRTEATLYAMQIGLVNPGAVSPAAEESSAQDANQTPAIEIGELLEPGAADGSSPLITEYGQKRPWKPRQMLVAALLGLALIVSGLVAARLLPIPERNPAVAESEATATPDFQLQRWSEKADLPDARKGMGVVEYDNAIYAFAGETDQGTDGAVRRYRLKENHWENLAKKPTPVTDIQAALLGEKIYVPGGRLSDGSETNVLEVYDPRQDRWESKAPLPVPTSAYALASYEGQLYLFGGKHGSQYLDTVYAYDPQEDRWNERTAMDAPRAFAGAAVTSGKIYVIGGFNGQHALDLNQAYLPTRDGNNEQPWETHSPLPEKRYAMGVTHLASIIFLLGGLNEQGQPIQSGALQYALQADQWAGFDGPPQDVGEQSVVLASGNFLYVLGGRTSAGFSKSNQSYQAIYTIAVPAMRSDDDSAP